MTRKEFQNFLDEWGFKPYAKIIKSKDKKPKHKHAAFYYPKKWLAQENWSKKGYVYIWAEEDKKDVVVVYVGKAGRTMKDRCTEHLRGFKGGRTPGKSHSDKILGGISKHKRYTVYARESNRTTIVREPRISMCDVEEKAFIKKLTERQPDESLWNKPLVE